MQKEEALAWLEALGNKFLGDGICESIRASELLAALSNTEIENDEKEK